MITELAKDNVSRLGLLAAATANGKPGMVRRWYWMNQSTGSLLTLKKSEKMPVKKT